MNTYLGAEQVLTDLWVQQQLATKSADFDTISPGLSARIFLDYAPEGTPYPFVIYQCQSPPRDVRGVGVVRVMVDTLYIVKAVAQVTSYQPLAPVARVIDAAMTSATGSPVVDGMVLASVREEGFNLLEIEGGTQYRHLGGQYRIHAQAQL